jgi:hypothetical protein
MITLSSLPLSNTVTAVTLSPGAVAAHTVAGLHAGDVLALLNAYKVAAAGGAPVATDAVTAAFAANLFAFVANRLALVQEIAQANVTPHVALLDEYGNASAELIAGGNGATPTF